MKTIFLKTMLLLFAIILNNCENKDPEDQLPPITQTGENTFGAIVDGSVFIPKDKTGYYAPGGGRPRGLSFINGISIPEYEYFSITARDYEGTYIYIYIENEIPEEVTYNFKSSPGVSASSQKPNYSHSFCIINNKNYVSFENSGSITFTKVEYDKGLYAGTFSISLKNKDNPNDTIQVTDGRFDVNLNTVNN